MKLTNNRIAIAIVTVGLILRMAFMIGRNYLIGADSYWFDWLAKQAQSGNDINYEHTGLTSFIVTLSRLIPLTAAEWIIPLLIYVCSSLLIYYLAKRMFGTGVALWSLLSWTIMRQALHFTLPTYIDRDGFSCLLVLAGVTLCYDWLRSFEERRLKYWTFVFIGAALAVIGQIIYYEWAYAGRWLYIVSIAVVIEVMLMPLYRPIKRWFILNKGTLITLVTFGVISLAQIVIYDLPPLRSGPSIGDFMTKSSDYFPITELQPINVNTMLFGWFPITLFVFMGAWLCFRERNRERLIILGWFGVFFILSCWAERCMHVALPSLAILSGISLAYLQEKYKQTDGWPIVRNAGIAVFVMLSCTGAWLSVYGSRIPDSYIDATDWMRNNTPEHTRVLQYYDSANRLLNLSERQPIRSIAPEISLLYCTDETEDIVRIMDETDCDYVIYSPYEYMIREQIRDSIGYSDYDGVLDVLHNGTEDFGPIRVVFRSGTGDMTTIVVALDQTSGQQAADTEEDPRTDQGGDDVTLEAVNDTPDNANSADHNQKCSHNLQDNI